MNKKRRRRLRPHLKVWLEAGGKPVFGDGKLTWLEVIAETGSLRQAAADLGMSYRGLWHRLRVMEERFGARLVTRRTGGPGGGGMTLTDDFALSLNVIGGAPWPFDPDQHFTHYDHPAYDTGRPSGYYSITSPPGEPVAYDFASGMLTVWAAQDVDLGPNGGTVGFDYAFENLPGRAVFSVYGLDETVGWIYHTNRGLQDVNNPSKPVSTFEVLPEPATLALAAAGAALALGRKRWRPGLRP